MWIEPYKDKYRAIERYTDPMTGKTRRVSTIIDKDTKAQRKAAETVLRIKIEEATTIKADSDITVQEVADKYINHQKQSVRRQTWKRDESMIHSVVKLLRPDVKANTLSARYISQQLESSKKGNVTLNTYLEHTKRMLKWAYRNDYIHEVAYLDKITPYPDKEKKARIEDKYLSSDELRSLLESMKIENWKLLTHFLALSGLRIGEALALEEKDVADYIHVDKTMDLINGIVTENAKTECSNRDVYIQPELATVIKNIRKYKKIASMRYGFRSDLFFPNHVGDHLNYYSYAKYLKENTQAVTGRTLTPHALRHTHVSLLAEKGVPLEVISRRVGHDNSTITRQIYLHITEKQREKDNEQIKNVKIL